ncbi:nitroreductase family protein [Aliivibrio salmonicida]|uniref:Nitroreductase n=1 Tax=Aliivibrio salmonicida (strain LFI1238) TaxID=316275 RepID=B6EQD6_ALISL|nr:nitroreductase family protein [Aliivibrio salmonicida]AZL86349.1 nitroreductase family protein [Aliivibrio salmonicida]CAQ80908.1 putative nitroreductase [Aliivibrio salmonicida LFI1238]
MNTILDVINNRRSINNYDPSKSLTKEQIITLMTLTTKAPSAFNLQNWEFVAVQSKDAKVKLKALAYGQQKIEESSVTFIVCGTLHPQELLAHSLAPSLEKGIISSGIVDGWVNAASNMYTNNSIFQRDEAIRSASLAGMTLMLAAEGMGLSSCPMIGFDPEGVKKAFGLSDNSVPTMLITVGYAIEDNWTQKLRRPLDEVLTIL